MNSNVIYSFNYIPLVFLIEETSIFKLNETYSK
jgi:hypothetical protein